MPTEATKAQNGTHPPGARKDLILRDRLAIRRTVLVNERTLLAYVRTALTLFLVGMSSIHVPMFQPNPEFGDLAYEITGWLFVAGAAVTAVIGHLRFRRFRLRTQEASDMTGKSP